MSGKIFFAFILSVILANLSARVVSWAYRRRMVKLMSSGAAPQDAAPRAYQTQFSQSAAPLSAGWSFSLSANRTASLCLALALVIISMLIGITAASFVLNFVYTEGGFGPIKLIVIGAVYSAPIVFVLGMLWRWSWWRTSGVACLYFFFGVAITWLRSNEQQSLFGIILWLGGQIGLPLAALLLLTGSGKTRAAAPYLFPPLFVLAGASTLGLDVLERGFYAGYSPWIGVLVSVFGATGTFVFFAIVPWVIAYWPIRAFGRWLARAYREKLFSEAIYLYAGYWLVCLLTYALPSSGSLGLTSFATLGAWLWIPIGLRLAAPLLKPGGAAPVLLVLRVFRRDAEVESLFDQIIESWRYTGSVALIAGTDLASRTLEPDDLFAFMEGSIAQRFIKDEAMLKKQLAQLDTAPDADGRYRVNDFYCFDTTWQSVLLALVGRADRVLMDLRGLTDKNLGCLFELKALGEAGHLAKIVLLTDRDTDGQAARAALGVSAAEDRIVWEDASRVDAAKARKILQQLVEAKAPLAAVASA